MTTAASHSSSPGVGDSLRGLLAAFDLEHEIGRFHEVPARDVPPPYDRLLVHDGHMTVTLEAYYGGPVHLKVLALKHSEHQYARKITLHARRGGPPVLVGIMGFDLRYCDAAARDEIIAGETPLGRILIERAVLKELTAGPYYRVALQPPMPLGINISLPFACHARRASIDCNGGRAVEVLEIITAV